MSSPPPLYDNNNETNQKMRDRLLIPGEGSVSASVSEEKRSSKSSQRGGQSRTRTHLNTLWSVWYGVFTALLLAYTAAKCARRYLRYAMLTWDNHQAIYELQASLLSTVFAVLLLPVFLAAAVFKVGNLANDGMKLGRCSTLENPDGSTAKCSLWRHGGPTAAFIHLVIAFALLVPKLVMEARLIESGYLPQDSIWRTDLDFMVVHHDRLVVLSFMTASSSGTNSSVTTAPVVPTPAPLESATLVATLNTSRNQPEALPKGLINVLRDLFNLDQVDTSIDAGWGSSVSVEYLNYALALLVYSVRYPAVFWNTNKCFGMVFSIQLLVNSVQSLLSYAGMSVLYKVQIIGAWKALPLLRHFPDGMSPLGGKSPFLLNAHVSLALFALSSLLVLSSSLVLYLYGHGRFNSFLNHQRDRKHIFFSNTSSLTSAGSGWGYFTHCAALCCLLAVAVCTAPLLHDYTLVYRGSLDGAILACIIAGILHLFLWVVVWLFLTIKHRWTFKLRVTVGKATVRSARSVKLVTDIDLMSSKNEDTSQQPLLIVGNGRTYTVTEHSPKKAIMSVVQKATLDRKAKSNASSTTGGSETTEDPETEEQIYWLRPALGTPQRSPDSTTGGKLCWLGSTKKHKVTFNDHTSSTSNSRSKGGGNKSKSRVSGGPGGSAGGGGTLDEDDGDYATLRELPLGAPHLESGDDTTSEEGKLLACVHDDNVTYASTSRDLIPPGDYEDPSPLLTPEPLGDRETDRLVQSTQSASVTTGASNAAVTVHTIQPSQPRCLRRADSGMPHEELTPRSDSISTDTSSSPPEPPGSHHSETSSGVHSNASSDRQHQPNQDNHHIADTSQMAQRRATSVADLAQPREDQWKSCSLQRNVQPPTNVVYPNNFYNFPHHTKNHSIGSYNASSSTHTNHTNGQPIYGYANKTSSFNPSVTSPNQVASANSSSQNIYGYTQTPPNSTPQGLYGYTTANGPQSVHNSSTHSVAQSGHAHATTQPNGSTQNISQPVYGYTTHNNSTNGSTHNVSQPLYGYTTQNTSSPQANGSNQPTYGYTTQNTSSGSTHNIAQPVYGYTTQNTSSPQGNGSSQSIYGYTQNPNPQYGYTQNNQQPIYGFTSGSGSLNGSTFSIKDSGGIPVILENQENTVVIRRKNTNSIVCENSQTPTIKEEPFGRSTNMKMTSFTENNDLKNIQSSSATLPHYPTQPINIQNPQQQYSTMPLPLQSKPNSQSVNLGAGTSCNVFPRQHTTIPTHHNGVRLFPANQNPYVKRFQQNGGVRMTAEGVYGQTKSQNEYFSS